jgi:hypothetical protein
MAGNNNLGRERQREKTRRAASADSVFLAALGGTGEEHPRVVVRNDIHLKALESARKALRLYHSERKRQI